MQEIELKILEIDEEEIVKKLEALGATRIGARIVADKQFDTPTGEMRRKDQLFRIRRDGKKSYLTLKTNKKVIGHFRINDEFEVEVANPEIAEHILAGLGFVPRRYREKYRVSYLLNELHIEIEKYPTIPIYLEIEGDQTSASALVEQLGYTMADTTSWTATQVLHHYGADINYQVYGT